MGVGAHTFEAMVPHILRGAAMEDRERERRRKEQAMARALKESPVDPVAHALDAAERPAREREAAERAQQAEAQQAEQRRWGVVATETLAKLRPIAGELERWRQRGPEGGAQLRDRFFSRVEQEAADRVFEQFRGVEEMIARDMAKLARWRDDLVGPVRPERFAVIIEGVRAEAQTWRSAESGLAATRTIRAQAAAQFAEARAVLDAHIKWFSDDAGATDATPREAA
jgi:hypothetical protein